MPTVVGSASLFFIDSGMALHRQSPDWRLKARAGDDRLHGLLVK